MLSSKNIIYLKILPSIERSRKRLALTKSASSGAFPGRN
uniref:Uncharacterized protein n=1 Tax=Escherichia coli TaxID=562 RepID=A0A1S7BFN7_ECOLX|nr:hypothetical protein [Escherichia coli]